MKDENKTEEKNKKNKLLETAFKLFTEKGIKSTSVQNIVDDANVGKGTFYIYFKDKYELRDILIARKSQRLFNDALVALENNYISNFSDQIIFVINYIIDALVKNPLLLKFISTNLSWGVYSETVRKISETDSKDGSTMIELFRKGVEKNNINLKNPDVTLYMIIELVSSTCFNSILYNNPLPIKDFKPYLYNTIRTIIEHNN